MKRVGTAMEQHDARELAELDEIGMASGHRREKKTKRRGRTLQRKQRRLKVDSRRGRRQSDEEGPRNGSDGRDGEGFSAEKT